jgi:hypothetical protein
MGNQQATLTEGEIGWLAGIIEGEGSITMNARTKNWKGWSGIGVDLTLCVSNTDGRILDRVADLFHRLTGSVPRINEFKKSPVYKPDGTAYLNPKTSIMNISVGRMDDILTVLKLIEPHMVGEKVGRARLMMKFIERRMSRKTPYTKRGQPLFDKYDWDAVAEFYKIKNRPLPPAVTRVLNEHERTRIESFRPDDVL